MRLKFSGNFASSSDVVLEFKWRPKKKVFTKIWRDFISIHDWKSDKKVFIAIWYCNWPEFGIYWCWQPLFCLIIQTPTFNGEHWNLDRGGYWNLDGGMLTLHGGHASTRYPYNLSTSYTPLDTDCSRPTIHGLNLVGIVLLYYKPKWQNKTILIVLRASGLKATSSEA